MGSRNKFGMTFNAKLVTLTILATLVFFCAGDVRAQGLLSGTAKFLSEKEIREVPVSVSIRQEKINGFLMGEVWRLTELVGSVTNGEPIRGWRYLLAAGVSVMTLFLAMRSFAKASVLGVEALGRNPIASSTIQIGIVINAIVTIMMIISGVVVSVAILVI